MAPLFGEIHTIEWAPGNHAICEHRFAGQAHIHCYLGSSPDLLPSIINPAKRTLFLLDAHYRGGADHEQDPARGQCPLLAELALITALEWAAPPTIIIDDANMFIAAPQGKYDPAHWPTLEQIKTALPTHELSIRNGMIYGLPKG
jgi:hypothetical protein